MTVEPFNEPAKTPLTEDELSGIERWANQADFSNAWVGPTLLSLVAEIRFAWRKLETVKRLYSESEAEIRRIRGEQPPTVVEPPGMSPVPLVKANREDQEAATDLG
jgi:hypothetical protein